MFRRLSDVLTAHCEPKRLVIVERFYFHKRIQAVGESIADFDAALRKLAIHCEFGATLEESLHDRFVCGLQHEATQRRLLSESAQTYQRVVEIAKAMETADTNTKSFKVSEPPIRKVSRASLAAANACNAASVPYQLLFPSGGSSQQVIERP